jgi:hypothetical protein
VLTHDAPATLDDRPILLKISESPCWQSDAAAPIGLERMRQKDAGAEQAEYCCYRFDHRRCPYARPVRYKTACEATQSKEDRAAPQIGIRLMISSNKATAARTGASVAHRQLPTPIGVRQSG